MPPSTPGAPAGLPLHRLRRRLLLGLVALAAVVTVSVAVLTAAQWHGLSTRLNDQSQMRARMLAHALDRGIEAVDAALDAVGERLPPDAQAATVIDAQALRGLPLLRSVSLLAADGRVLASTETRNLGLTVPLVALRAAQPHGLGRLQRGRDLHAVAAAEGAASAVVDFIPYLRPIRRDDGRRQWLVAALNPDHIGNELLVSVDDDRQLGALFDYEGHPLAGPTGHASTAAATGRPPAPHTAPSASSASAFTSVLPLMAQTPDHPLFDGRLSLQGHGQWQGNWPGGPPALMAYQSLRHLPAVVVTGWPASAMRAMAGTIVLRNVAVGLALLAVAGLLAAMAWRGLRRREHIRHDLASTRETLAAHDAFTDRLFQLSPVPMVVKDLRRRYVRINPAWSRFTGRSAQDVIGRKDEALFDADTAAPLCLHDQLVLDMADATAHEIRLPDADGRMREVVVRLTPFTGTDGRTAGLIACLLDISAFREAETRSREAREAAERANAAKGQFLANISHELRTPLQTIIGFSELGGSRTRADTRAQSMFTDIHAAGQRMLKLVNTLLDLARLGDTDGTLPLEPSDLATLLTETVERQQAAAHARGLHLHWPEAGPPLPVNAHRERLQQVLEQLLDNAFRWSPPQGQVHVHWWADGHGQACFSVSDHGAGIPAGEEEHILDAFEQSSRTRTGAGGTGLGLALCRRVVKAHGGVLQAGNRPEGGACFTVSLPSRPGGRRHDAPAANDPPAPRQDEPHDHPGDPLADHQAAAPTTRAGAQNSSRLSP